VEIITKVCNKCGLEKSVSEFCRDTHAKDGFYTMCKSCKKASRKLEWGASYRKNHSEKKVEYNKKYNAEHKEQNHNRYISNFSKYAAASKERYEKNKESIKEYYQAWRNRNAEKKKAYDSEYSKKYRREHPEKSKEYDHRRRAKIKQVGGRGFTNEQWEQLKKDYGYMCAYCNKKKPLTIDHVIPIDNGGAHDISNMVPACKSCNSAKQAKPLFIYLLHRLKNGR